MFTFWLICLICLPKYILAVLPTHILKSFFPFVKRFVSKQTLSQKKINWVRTRNILHIKQIS